MDSSKRGYKTNYSPCRDEINCYIPGLMHQTSARVGMTIMLIIIIYRPHARESSIPVNYYIAHLQLSCKFIFDNVYIYIYIYRVFKKKNVRFEKASFFYFFLCDSIGFAFFVICYNWGIVLISDFVVLSDCLCYIAMEVYSKEQRVLILKTH